MFRGEHPKQRYAEHMHFLSELWDLTDKEFTTEQRGKEQRADIFIFSRSVHFLKITRTGKEINPWIYHD